MTERNASLQQTPVVIIGGGPAGMACAWELAKAGRRAVVLEREAQVGGLARTLSFTLPGAGVFRTDIGPHRFFSKNRYLYQMIEDVLGDRWIQVERFTRFHIGGRFYLYPPQIKNVMQGMGVWRCCKVVRDILWERFKDLFRRRKITTFEDHVIHEFGRTLAEFNMINYTEKIWGLPCREISPHWAEQRIKGLGIVELIKSLFRKKGGEPGESAPAAAGGATGGGSTSHAGGAKSLVDRFYYPAGGAGVTYETIRAKIGELGGCAVESGCQVEAVTWENGRVTGVRYSQGGESKTIPCDQVVSTMLLTDLTRTLSPAAPPAVLQACDRLRYRSQVYLLLMINRERIGPDNWVYFPDAEVPFARFYEPKCFSTEMAPPGKTSLLLEHFCFTDDATWQAVDKAPEALAEADIAWLIKLGFVKHRAEVLGWRFHRERNVYPIYDLTYEAPLKTVLDFVDGIPNLICAGRGGRFRYTNQDHSLEMGILAAQSILRGVKLAVENVGAERGYFEAGYVPAKAKK